MSGTGYERGSVRLAEKHLPFAVVFIVNHLMAEMATAVESAGGYYSNFTGDGLMALFGLRPVPDHGARAALVCAAQMLEHLDAVNRRLSHHLDEPLRVGIGVHTGVAIVGRMGPPAHPVLTALGDNAKVSARLQELCKETASPAMVSATTLAAVGADFFQLNWYEPAIRGRVTPLPVAAMHRETLQQLLAETNTVG